MHLVQYSQIIFSWGYSWLRSVATYFTTLVAPSQVQAPLFLGSLQILDKRFQFFIDEQLVDLNVWSLFLSIFPIEVLSFWLFFMHSYFQDSKSRHLPMKNAFIGSPHEVNYAKAKLGVSFNKLFVNILMNISPSTVDHCIKALLMKIKVPLHFP